MANSHFSVLEFRAIIKPEWTELFILAGPPSDGMLGVQGWYKRIIPPTEAAIPALTKALTDLSYLTEWDRGIPEAPR